MDATRTTLLALDLFGSPGWSADKEIQRLHALSNHAGRHYRRIILSKRHGGQRLVLAPDYLLKTVQRNILKNVLSQFPLSLLLQPTDQLPNRQQRAATLPTAADPETRYRKLFR